MKYVLISKDAMCTDYLPIYGNKRWNTPNIDKIANTGTVFRDHYTAAPSTVMSFFSMVTGTYAHETKYEMYEKVHDIYEGETFFTKLKKMGFKCHYLFDEMWEGLTDYYDCYRGDIEFHSLKKFRQGVGAHYSHDGFLKPDKMKEDYAFKMVKKAVEEILSSDENVFLWVHFPHVIYGRVSYGDDIELFDKYIGMIMQYVPDNSIAITADHGNMNGHKGKICYGYDVYQPAIRIPLITPRINGLREYNGRTSNVDLFSILFENRIPKRKFCYSDSAYCAQGHRKLAILYDHYKYIYNKKTKVEELYDLEFDPTEEFSLIEDYVYDQDRKVNAPSRELYYYPNWDELDDIRKIMRNEKKQIWKDGSIKVVAKSTVKDFLRPLYTKLTTKKSTASTNSSK